MPATASTSPKRLRDALEPDGRRRVDRRSTSPATALGRGSRRQRGRDRQAAPRRGRVGIAGARAVERTACQAGPRGAVASPRPSVSRCRGLPRVRVPRRRDGRRPCSPVAIASPMRHGSPRRSSLAVLLGARRGCAPAPPPATPPIVAGAVAMRRARSTSSPGTTRSCPTPLDLVPARPSCSTSSTAASRSTRRHRRRRRPGRLGGRRGRDRRRAARARRRSSACRPGSAGLRIVVRSGERRRRRLDGARRRRRARCIVGCHIPGHWAKGMQVPVRWVAAGPSRRRRRAPPR